LDSFPTTLPDLPRLLGELIRQVPMGRVTTYGTLAEALGAQAAARWVGHWMLHHKHTVGCPCHRVVRADGDVGQYIAGAATRKWKLLNSEGVRLDEERVLDMPKNAFRQFATSRPLVALRDRQEALAEQISLRGRRTMPRRVAGVDVSYAEDHATGAYVLWDSDRHERVWSTTVQMPVTFPYITGFLAYRELPVLLALVERARQAGQMADVIIVDGSGVLHPRGVGIACHLGVLAGVPTIGVSKKLLCGMVDIEGLKPEESRPVLVGGRRRGVALRATSGSKRPIFVSPGHRIGVGMAELIVRGQLRGRRLPEVQYWADRLSRAAARK